MADGELLRHVVLFGFKAETSADEVAEIVRRFAGLRERIDTIVGFEWGANNSPEGLNQDLSHAFTLTFTSEADRDAYLPHLDHAAFADWVGPYVEHVTVVDYWAKAEAP